VSHWVIVPVLLPGFTAVYLLLSARFELAAHRVVSLLSTLGLVAVASALLAQAADGAPRVYALGNWPAPFGIVLVLDRLSALMVLLTAVVGLASLLQALHGWDTRGSNYHALFQFQLMGLCGAFLTGDLFNLFVFFEVLLIASFGLLLHGGGRERLTSGLHYVVLNLVGSAFFLLALGIVYGTTGTLNLADLAVKVPALGPAETTILESGALLLLVVFALKAAVLPLYFWLPGAYAAAAAPVAALFAIMTKVGIYGILRVYTLAFGSGAGALAERALPVLVPAGLLTLALATLGVLGARDLRRLVAYLVITSVGTLLVAIGLATAEAIAGALYYLVHSTLVLAALFLLAELLAEQRGASRDLLRPAPAVLQPVALGVLFFVAAVAVSGMPPLSGFVGKVLILQGALASPERAWVFALVLGSGLLTLLALGRAGSALFWNTAQAAPASGALRASGAALLPVAALLALAAALVALARPVQGYASATAAQLLDPRAYVESVLGSSAGGVERPPGGLRPAREGQR
jgi:multicomponent K+:H+ antiporter subunit D